MGELEGMRELEALPPEVGLTERIWRFGPLGDHPYATHVRLLPDGLVAGNLSDNESAWVLRGGRLLFLDGAARTSTSFDRVYAGAEGRLAFVGTMGAGRDHLLMETAALGGMAESGPALLSSLREPRRPNLVLIRANEGSVHPSWPRDLNGDERSWDLCVSWYGGAETLPGEDEAEHRVLQNRQRQYEALYALLHRDSPLWSYDFIALPDDDVMASWRDWNALFAICRQHRLELAQPALRFESHVTHPITRRDERYRLRYVSFVESMTPIFSRAALQACVGTFQHSRSGFGLDNIWPKLLPKTRDRLAVIDAVPVLHTRPQGGSYDVEAALREGDVVQAAYGAPSQVLEFGGVLADPVDRQHAW